MHPKKKTELQSFYDNLAANDNAYCRLISTNTRSFTYTSAGNMATDDRATDPDVSYTYGGRNRLESVTVGGVTTTYKINALGERVSKDDGTNVTQYVYDDSGRLIAESNGSTGAVIREYVWLGNMPLAQIDSGGIISFIQSDWLNTPQKITDAGGTILWDRQQQPFLTPARTDRTRSTFLTACGIYHSPRHNHASGASGG